LSHIQPAIIVGAVSLLSSCLSSSAEEAGAPRSSGPSVRQAFVQSHCLDCHDAETQKEHLDLTALKPDAADAESLAAWVKVHDRVRAGEMPPPKKAQPKADERDGFVRELAQTLQTASQAQQARDGRARARRLNRDEYQTTLRDLLGVHRDYRSLLPEDGRALGFDKVSSALSVSAEHLEAYMAAAEAALNDAFTPEPAPMKQHLPQRWEDMSRLQRVFSYQFAQAPDALVYFSDHWDNITGFEARQPGRYRFKVRGRAFQSDEPVKARVRAGLDNEASRRIVTYTEFPPGGAEFVVETWLNPRETLHICPIGTAPPARNPTTHRVNLKRDNPGSRYKGPGLALEWVEVEGPLPDDRLHTTILAGVDLQTGTRADAEKVLTRFLPLAFRRPVVKAEVGHFLKLFDAEAGERGFTTGLKGAMQAALCSPHFLYLHGRPGPLDDYALASRLSYFLWNSMPDDALRSLALEGRLRSPDTLRQQVERMLNDPRAEAFSESFTGQWLDLRLINATTPDPELYPEFDELLAWSSVSETRLFFDEVLRRDLSLLNFVQSDFLMLNDRLARHYGIPGVDGIAFRSVANPSDGVRGGLLGQASVLKVTANGTTTSPILRGVWMMDRLIGKPPPPPPAGVPALEPDIRGASNIREQLAKHRDEASCAACHVKIDPPGFALESFDVIGGWRDRYRASREGAQETIPVSRPLYLDVRSIQRDPKSRVHPMSAVGLGPVVVASSEFEGKAFRDVKDFRTALLADPDQLARAFVTKLATYATGTGLQFADRAVVDDIVRRLKEHNLGVRSAIHEVVQSPLFLNR